MSVLAFALASAVTVSGVVDVYWGFNLNQPEFGDNFFPGAGTSGLRHNQISLNLAALGAERAPEPVGFTVRFVAGTGAQVLHDAEPGGALDQRIWDHVGEASVAWAPARALRLDAGVLRAPGGFESFYSVENWSYTRSWVSELQPYLEAGVRARWEVGAGFRLEGHVMNGWNTIGDVNEGKTFALQAAWASECSRVALTGMAGPERRDVDLDWRVFGDLVGAVRVHERVELAANASAGWEHIDYGQDATWHGAAGYARVKAADWMWIALRGGWFHDPDGHLTGTVQTLGEGTVTIELRPHPALVLKAEGRYDRSTSAVFSGTDTTPVAPEATRRQLLFLGSAAATF